ncbi:MAG: GNAT family N-acetyltransferase [Armatimonadota bacterium]
MTDEIILRPCRPEDLPAISALTVRAFAQVSIDAHLERQYGLLRATSWGERKCQAILGEIAANPDGCFSALLGDRVVGYITTSVDEQAGIGRIINLAVDTDWHGRGLGKRLLCRAFECFRDRELPYYRIETTTDNEVGQALYPRCGFAEVTRQIVYFMSADEAADWTHTAGEKQESP